MWKNKKTSADAESKALDAMQQQAGDAKGAVESKEKEIQVRIYIDKIPTTSLVDYIVMECNS